MLKGVSLGEKISVMYGVIGIGADELLGNFLYFWVFQYLVG
jgi:hypothetical protein